MSNSGIESDLKKMAMESRGNRSGFIDVALDMAGVGDANEKPCRWQKYLPKEVVSHWHSLSLESQLIAYSMAQDWADTEG